MENPNYHIFNWHFPIGWCKIIGKRRAKKDVKSLKNNFETYTNGYMRVNRNA